MFQFLNKKSRAFNYKLMIFSNRCSPTGNDQNRIFFCSKNEIVFYGYVIDLQSTTPYKFLSKSEHQTEHPN